MLAKRFSDNRKRIPKDVLDELRALGQTETEAPDRAALH